MSETSQSYFNANAGARTGPARQRPSSPSPLRPHPPMVFGGRAPFNACVTLKQKDVLSRAHVENIDTEHRKEVAQFERSKQQHRQHVGEHWHNDGPKILEIWEQGHIADRGLGKTVTQANTGVFNPILSHFVIPPVPKTVAANGRPLSAPHQRQPSFSTSPSSPAPCASSRADKAMQRTMGVTNPITGRVTIPSDPHYAARKQLEFDRVNGGRSVHAHINLRQVNPITGEETFRQAPASPADSRPQSAPRILHAAGATSPAPSPSKKVLNGDTWGTYNPINHVWKVAPRDVRYHDPSAMLNKTKGLTGNQHQRAVDRPSQGVYNPIQNIWTVPPTNTRMVEGLAFAPATLFCRTTPTTLRAR